MGRDGYRMLKAGCGTAVLFVRVLILFFVHKFLVFDFYSNRVGMASDAIPYKYGFSSKTAGLGANPGKKFQHPTSKQKTWSLAVDSSLARPPKCF